jgi:hypothetical protein
MYHVLEQEAVRGIQVPGEDERLFKVLSFAIVFPTGRHNLCFREESVPRPPESIVAVIAEPMRRRRYSVEGEQWAVESRFA